MSEQEQADSLKSKVQTSTNFIRWLNEAQFLGICPSCRDPTKGILHNQERVFQKSSTLLGTRYRCNVCRAGFLGEAPLYTGESNNVDKPRVRPPREAFIQMMGTREVQADHQSSEVGSRVPAITLLPQEWDALIALYEKGGEAALIDLVRNEKGEISSEMMLVHPDRLLREYETRVEAVKRTLAKRENDKKADLQARDSEARFLRYQEATHVRLECGCYLERAQIPIRYSRSIERAQRNGWKISHHTSISCSNPKHETLLGKDGELLPGAKDYRDRTAMKKLCE